MDLSQEGSGKLVGEYRLLRRLGVGSFGEVYQAENVREHRLVAIKLIKAPLTQREDLKAFLNEARSMRLRHPHIVPLLDFGLSEQDLPFLVMEYVAGGTLRDRYPRGSRVPLDRVVDVTTQLASALQYAHDRHLIHRDVKPENMLCRPDDTVLLSDFGIAAVAHASSSVSASQSISGTLSYMAPEQLAGKPRPASDQYALAVVVYEWLAGTRPFQGTPPEVLSQHLHAPPPSLLEQIPTLPTEVEQVVFKALAKQPQERFARVDDFAVALQVASQRRVALSSLSPSSPELPAPAEWKQPVPDRIIEPDQRSGGEAPSVAFPTPPGSSIRIGHAIPGEILPIISHEATTIISAGTSDGTAPHSPASIPHPAQHRRALSRRLLFTFGLVLLVILSGSGLWYFTSGGQGRLPLSPNQVATQTYTTETTSQGVMFGFDAAHTHNNLYEHILSPANVSQLTLLWSFTAGHYVASSPAIAGGVVYVGSHDHKLYAFDASCRKDCQPLWSFATGDSIISSPAVAGGVAYVGSMDNKLYAFDARCRKDCQPLWSFATDGQIRSSPAVAGGVVYVGSDDHKLYAFDAGCRSACQPLWSFATGDSIWSSPAVAGGLVYIGSNDDKFYAFDARCRKGCQPLWSFASGRGVTSVPRDITSSPAVAGGMVYIGSVDSKLYAFDARCRSACQPLWSFATGGGITTSPAVAGGVVYVGSHDSKLYAFDARCRSACQPLQSFDAGGIIWSSPAIADGMVYVGSLVGKFYAFGLAS